jgi:ATP-binding cassette subfamily C (CFTR/MRP) protein 1
MYLLIRWTSSPPFFIHTSIPTSAINLVTSFAILTLSILEHLRSVRPSTILQLYLFLTLILDLAICRTLWLVNKDSEIQTVFTAVLVLKFLLFSLEVLEKRRWLLPPYRHLKAESTSGLANLSVFWWLNRLFILGYQKILSLSDIEGLEESHRAQSLASNFQQNWTTKTHKEKPHALIRTIAWTLRYSLLASVFPRLCSIGFKFSQPFLIGSVIEYLDSESREGGKGNGLIGAYVLAYTGIAVSSGVYWYKTYRTITLVRGTLIAVVYSKTLDLALNTGNTSSSSALMSVDVERICACLVNLHELWADIIEVGIAVYILERNIGVACISPALLAFGEFSRYSLLNGRTDRIACGLATLLLTSRIGKSQDAWLKAVQRRLKMTESTLGSIKGIKIMGLAKTLAKILQDMRVTELSLAMNYRTLQVTSIVICKSLEIIIL